MPNTVQRRRMPSKLRKWLIGAAIAIVLWMLALLRDIIVPPVVAQWVSTNSPEWLEDYLLPISDAPDGRLISANRATPSIVSEVCGTALTKDPNSLFIIWGSNVSHMVPKQSETNIVKRGSRPLIWVKRSPGGYLDVFGSIYSERGKSIARLIGNSRFEVIEPQYGRVRKNPWTLKIEDKNGDEIFYIKYINEQTVKVRGTLYAADQAVPPIRISEDELRTSEPQSQQRNCHSNNSTATQF